MVVSVEAVAPVQPVLKTRHFWNLGPWCVCVRVRDGAAYYFCFWCYFKLMPGRYAFIFPWLKQYRHEFAFLFLFLFFFVAVAKSDDTDVRTLMSGQLICLIGVSVHYLLIHLW